ncbi:TonB-dependent receptor [Gammaproteobacteria bacterium]|nr:TonB-dependent receptor [Gammaproteobacteria bacterium]
MNIIKNSAFVFLISTLISFFSTEVFSDPIEEIVVKGSWRQTSAAQEDSSVIFLSSDVIKAQSMKHFEQLSFLVPNLNFAASDSRARYFQIRGIGERSGYQGTPNSSVGFLIDDIDYSGQGGIATTFDLDQIEVYRGPQGSRIGANALAGLIYIQTKDPTDTFEGTSEVTIGSYGTKSAGVAFGGPLDQNPDITYRIALRKDKADGFRKNLYLKRLDTSRKDESTGRLKVNWQLADNTKIKFLISQVDLNDPADIWTIDGSLNTLSDRQGMDSQKTNSYGMKVFHSFDGFELQSYTSSTDTNVIFSYDADWGNTDSHFPYVYDYFSETLRDRKSFNQEFRAVSNSADFQKNSFFEWVIGANYLELKETNLKKDDGLYGDPSDPYGPYASASSSSSKYKSSNFSVFGNLDYLLSASLKFSIGLRWEDWEADYSDSLQESFNPTDKMSGGKISLIKNMTNDTNMYASLARGYKQGGFNLGLGLDANSRNKNLAYDPEFLTNYELGINTKLLDSRVTFNGVLFYSDREDQQVLISTQTDPSDPNTFSFLTQNAAEGVNHGLEINMDLDINESLSAFVNLGILKTEIKNWQSRQDLEGRSQAHAPERSYALGLNWAPTSHTYLAIDFTGKSSFYYSDSHNNKSKSYVLTNLNLGYVKNNWNYELWARNIFDEYYSVRGFYFGNEAPNFIDTLYERHGDPMHIGLSIRYDF